MRPAIKYNGAKWLLANWILSHFPPHETYLDVFGGSAAVLIQKPPAKYEIYNDLDEEVVNFFRVLRSDPKTFAHAIDATPYARSEFTKALEPVADPFERARRFYCLCWMSISYNYIRNTGWRLLPRNAGGGHVPQKLFAQTKHLLAIAKRLKAVQFENRDFRLVLKACDHPGILIYADPPYPGYCDRLYNVPFSAGDYAELIMLLSASKGMVVLSGYEDMHEQMLLQGWHMVTKETRNRSRKKRTECLMLNPAAWRALNGAG